MTGYPVEVVVRAALAPDGTVRVLLQLGSGYVLLRPADALTLASVITDLADGLIADAN